MLYWVISYIVQSMRIPLAGIALLSFGITPTPYVMTSRKLFSQPTVGSNGGPKSLKKSKQLILNIKKRNGGGQTVCRTNIIIY